MKRGRSGPLYPTIDPSDGRLYCPGECESHNIHHEVVVVENRTAEDEDGTQFEVDGDTVKTRAISRDKIMGRRDNVLIKFWCEQCGPWDDDGDYCTGPYAGICLRIFQHKGCTYLEWEEHAKAKPSQVE